MLLSIPLVFCRMGDDIRREDSMTLVFANRANVLEIRMIE
jgi:hypothetical protein